MRLLDRYLLQGFLKAYLACFVCFLSLCIVIDLFAQIDEFTKTDEFTGEKPALATLLGHMGSYYLFRIPWLFQRLGPVFSLAAAMFTLSWLERQNELIPWLAAGVPMRRLLCPLLAGLLLVAGVALLNRELLMPWCGPYLERKADDPEGRKNRSVPGRYDENRIHIEGILASPQDQLVQGARITLPPELLGELTTLECAQMVYRPAHGQDTSGWYLIDTVPAHVPTPHPALNWLRPGIFFLHTELSFQELIRSPNWFQYESTAGLIRLLQEDRPCQRRAEVLALVHRRLTEPLLEILQVMLGVAVVLGRSQKSLFFKLGACVLVCGLFQGSQFICHSLASKEHLDAVLAAWLPVLTYGPLAAAWAEGIRT